MEYDNLMDYIDNKKNIKNKINDCRNESLADYINREALEESVKKIEEIKDRKLAKDNYYQEDSETESEDSDIPTIKSVKIVTKNKPKKTRNIKVQSKEELNIPVDSLRSMHDRILDHFEYKFVEMVDERSREVRELERENKVLKERVLLMENRFEKVVEAMYRMKEKIKFGGKSFSQAPNDFDVEKNIGDNNTNLYQLSDSELSAKIKELNRRKKAVDKILTLLTTIISDYEDIMATKDETYEDLLELGVSKTKDFITEIQFYLGSYGDIISVVVNESSTGIIISINEDKIYPIKMDKDQISLPILLAKQIKENTTCLNLIKNYFNDDKSKLIKEITFYETLQIS